MNIDWREALLKTKELSGDEDIATVIDSVIAHAADGEVNDEQMAKYIEEQQAQLVKEADERVTEMLSKYATSYEAANTARVTVRRLYNEIQRLYGVELQKDVLGQDASAERRKIEDLHQQVEDTLFKACGMGTDP